MCGCHQQLYDLLVSSYMEYQLDEVGTKGLMECWVLQLEWVDKAR